MTAVCKACDEPCRPVQIDLGIGAYEYWGARGFDSQLVWVSSCCEADYTEEET